MEAAMILIPAALIAVSAFLCGYTMSEYRHSDYYIREQVEKRLKSALDERCKFCQHKNVMTENTSEAQETANAIQDI